MRSLSLCLALVALATAARAQNIAVLNHASGYPFVAAESVAEIRGSRMVEVPIIEDDPRPQPEMAGVRVEVDGVPALLRSVAPERIVFYVPRLRSRSESGWKLVRLETPLMSASTLVWVQPAAPGLYRIESREARAQALYRVGRGAPAVIGDFPVPYGSADAPTVVMMLATGLHGVTRDQVQVRVNGVLAEWIHVGPFIAPFYIDAVTFEIPAAARPDADGLLRVCVQVGETLSNVVTFKAICLSETAPAGTLYRNQEGKWVQQ